MFHFRSVAAGIGAVAVAGMLAVTAQAQEAVRFALNSPTTTAWQTYVAEEQGFFKKNGVSVEIGYTGGGSLSAAQLISGAFDLAVVDVATALRLSATKAPIKITGVLIIKSPFTIVTAKGVTSVKDLVGKTISLAYKNDLNTVFWHRMLADNNIEVGQVDEIFDASTNTRFAALVNGAAQASLLAPPFTFRAAEHGFATLNDYSRYTEGFAFLAVIARSEWLEANSEAAKGFHKAHVEATEWLYNPANRGRAIEIGARLTKQSDSITAESYDFLIGQQMFNQSLRLSEEILNSQIDTLVKLGDIEQLDGADVLELNYLP